MDRKLRPICVCVFWKYAFRRRRNAYFQKKGGWSSPGRPVGRGGVRANAQRNTAFLEVCILPKNGGGLAPAGAETCKSRRNTNRNTRRNTQKTHSLGGGNGPSAQKTQRKHRENKQKTHTKDTEHKQKHTQKHTANGVGVGVDFQLVVFKGSSKMGLNFRPISF